MPLFQADRGRSLSRIMMLAIAMTAMLAPKAVAQQASLPEEVIAYADTVLYNGKILTVDPNFSIVQAVAVRDGKFLATGPSDRITAMAGPNTRRIDLKGKMVVPGILDIHQHPFSVGIREYWNKKWLPGGEKWTNKQEMLDGIKGAVARAKEGELVVLDRSGLNIPRSASGGRGGSICEVLTLADLDSVSPNTPVFFMGVVNVTAIAINSKAAEAIAPYLPEGVTDPFEREGNPCIGGPGDVDGELTVGAQAVNDYIYWALPFDELMEAYREASLAISASGTTLVKEHTAPPIITGIRELWARKELTVRLRMPFPLTPVLSGMTTIIPGKEAETFFRRMGNISGIGDDMWRFVGIRPPAVGGNMLGGDMWTLFPKTRPYPDRWGNASPYGGRIQEQEAEKEGRGFRGREAVVAAVRFGWDVSADHTVGDRATHEVVNAYEEGLNTQIIKRPGQLLTMNHTPMAAQEDIQRMKDLGINASIGVWHMYGESNFEAGMLMYGVERLNNILPVKSYLDVGLHPALEGDTNEGPTFERLQIAITRKDRFYHKAWNPKEAVNREQALRMVTIYPAEHIGESDRIGSIERGKLADLVIIDQDYLTIPEDNIATIKPLLTMVDGKVVYEAEGAF